VKPPCSTMRVKSWRRRKSRLRKRVMDSSMIGDVT
jgi:hypothetical protein